MSFNVDVNVIDIPIQGKMLQVTCRIPMSYRVPEQDIKKELAEYIAQQLIDSNSIMFTRKEDPNTLENMFLARVIVTPSTDVQIIRKMMTK